MMDVDVCVVGAGPVGGWGSATVRRAYGLGIRAGPRPLAKVGLPQAGSTQVTPMTRGPPCVPITAPISPMRMSARV